MVAVVGGSELGLGTASGLVLGARGQIGSAAQGRANEGVTVNAVTGNLILRRQDEFLAGVGADIGIVRTYNSLGLYNDDNGDNWRLGFSRKVYGLTGTLNTAGSTIKRVDEDGAEVVYTFDVTRNAYVSAEGDGAFDTLTYDAGTQVWTWVDGSSQMREHYDGAEGGRLTDVVDLDGNVLSLSYNAAGLISVITDANGERTLIDYDTAAGKTSNITQIRTEYKDANNVTQTLTRVRYSYDADNRLSAVTIDLSPEDNNIADGETYVIAYTYDGSSKRIASMQQSDGSLLKFYYTQDGSNRLASIEDYRSASDIRTTTFSYDTVNRTTTVTDALGQATVLTYDAQGQILSIRNPAVNGVSQTTSFTYDALGNVTTVTDARGNTVTYGYDGNGNRVLERDALGNTVTRTYGASNQLLSETTYTVADPDGTGAGQPGGAQTTEFVYDDALHLRYVVSPEGRVTEYRYNAIGQRTSAIDYPAGTLDRSEGALWRQGFDSGTDGLTELPAGYMTVSDGVLTSTTAAVAGEVWPGVRSLQSYAFGATIRAEIGTGPSSAGRYFIFGADNGNSGPYRRHAVYFEDGNIYALVSDASGNQSVWLGAAQDSTNYVVEVETQPSGLSTLYVYPQGQTRATGYSHRYRFSDWQDASIYFESHGAPDLPVATMTLDNLGVSLAPAWLQTFQGGANDLGVLPAGMSVTADGLLVENLAAASDSWPSVAGTRLRALGSVFRSEVTTGADSTGRELVIGIDNTDSGGAYRRMAALFEGDTLYANVYGAAGKHSVALGTVTDNTTYAIEIVTEADGWVTLSVYPKGLDPRSGFIYREQISGWSEARTYLETHVGPGLSGATMRVGLLEEMPAYTEQQLSLWLATQNPGASRRTDYAYDVRGQVSQVTTYAAVDAGGNGVADGSQASTQYIYDQAGQLLAKVDPRGVATAGVADDYVTAYTYDGLGRMLSATDALGNQTLMGYDDANRLTAVLLANGLFTLTTYDQGGLAVAVVQSEVSAAYTALGTTEYLYDALGRQVRETDPNGNQRYRLYDAAGRLAATIDAAGGVTEYLYNANNQVIRTIAYSSQVDLAALGAANPLTLNLNALRPPNYTDNRVSYTLYNAAGQVAKTVDGTGAVVEYRYDGAGRLLETMQYATLLSETQLEALAALGGEIAPDNANATVAVDAANDRHVRRFYSADGLLLGTLDGEGYLTENRYDGAGQLIETIGYATQTPSAHWATGTLEALRPAPDASNDQHTYYLYNTRAQLTGVIDAENYLTEYRYDLAGNRSSTIRYATAVTVAADKTVDQLRPSTHAEDQRVNYQYDALNRLARTDSLPDGLITAYTYDSVGNLIRTETALGAPEQRMLQVRYDIQGRVVQELSAVGALALAALGASPSQAQIDAVWQQYAVTYTYDAGGRRLSMTDVNGNRTVYYYDAAGQMTFMINALGEVTQYYYSMFGDLAGIWRYTDRLSASTLSVLTDGEGEPVTSLGQLSGGQDSALADLNDYLADYERDYYDARFYTNRGELLGQRMGSPTELNASTTEYFYNAFGELQQRRTLTNLQQQPDELVPIYSSDSYAYNQRGLLTQSVRDVDGLDLTTTTRYDAFGRAIEVTDGRGKLWKTGYDRAGRVVTTTDPGNALRQTGYDAFGRVLTQTDALGNLTQYRYDSANRSLTVTTAEGIATTTVQDHLGQTVSVADGRGNTTTYVYDADGHLASVTTPAGTVGSSYDRAGQLIETVDANGVHTVYTYDAAGRVLTRTLDPSGLNLISRTRYDGQGRAVWQQDARGIWTRTDYDSKGEVTAVTVDPLQVPGAGDTLLANAGGLDLQTTYTFDARGKILAVTEGAGSAQPKVTHYDYDALGQRVAEHVDPAGLNLTTRYTYDANGNVVARTDATGAVTRYTYTERNELQYSVDASGAVTHYDYDANGRITSTTAYSSRISLDGLPLPAGSADISGRLSATPTTDPLTRTVYDQDGRIRFTLDGRNGVVERSYDASGNIVQVRRYITPISMPGTLTEATLASAVAAIASAADSVERLVYDSANRLQFKVDGVGAVVQYEYDANGQVVSTTAYSTLISLSGLPAVPTAADISGRLSPSAADAVTRVVYDNAGRARFTLDPLNGVIERRFDAAGQVTQTVRYATAITLPGTLTEATLADAVAAIASAADRIDRVVYEAAGRVQFSLDSVGAVRHYVYDANGRLTQTTAYATLIDLATLPEPVQAADISALLSASAQDQVTRSVFDAVGRQQFRIDGTGAVVAYAYDGAGRIIQTTAYANRISLTGLSATATAAEIGARLSVSAQDQVTRTLYDAVGNARFSLDASNGVIERRFDALGHVTQTLSYARAITLPLEGIDLVSIASAVAAIADAGKDRIESATYDAAGRVATRTSALGAVTQYRYDGAGRVITETSGTRSVRHVYDAAGREVFTIDPERYVTGTAYDALGNVVRTNRHHEQINTAGLSAAPTLVDIASLLSADPAPALDHLHDSVRDSKGRIVYEIDGEGYVTQYSYDAFDHISLSQRYATPINRAALGAPPTPAQVATLLTGNTVIDTQAYEYDVTGRVIAEYKGDASAYSATRYQYDAFGNQIGIIDPRGDLEVDKTPFTTTQTFDAANRKIDVTNGLGEKIQTVYDAFGRIVQTLDANGNSGYFFYDQSGRVAFQIDPSGYVVEHRYDALGNELETLRYANQFQQKAGASADLSLYTPVILTAAPASGSEPMLYVVRNETKDERSSATYNPAGQKLSITDALLNTETIEYNAYGEVIKRTDRRGFDTTYTYDTLGRQLTQTQTITQAQGATPAQTVTTQYVLDSFGNKTQVIEALGLGEQRSTQYIYDLNNRLVRSVLPTVQMSSDTVIPETMNFTNIPHTLTYTYGYVGGKGQITTGHYYIGVSQLVDFSEGYRVFKSDGSYQDFPAGTTTLDINIGYDYSKGLPAPTQLYAFVAGVPQLVAQFSGVMSPLSYTAATTLRFSNITGATTMRLEIWPNNNPNAVQVKTYTVNANNVVRMTRPYGDSGTYSYKGYLLDANGGFVREIGGAFSISGTSIVMTRIDNTTVRAGVMVAPEKSTTYDAMGRVTIETNENGGKTYHYYDAMGRRVATVDAERYLHEYQYDAAGNLVADRTYSSRVDAAFNLGTGTGTTARPERTDLAGSGDSFRETSYRYDVSNRVVQSSTREVLVYDRAGGTRLQSLVTQHDYDAMGNVTRITHPDGGKSYAYYDARGNLIAEVDPEGYLQAYQYDAFGNKIAHARYAQRLSPATLAALSVNSDPTLLENELKANPLAADRLTLYDYDGLNRVIAERVQDVTYSSFVGNVRQDLTDEQIARFEYDADGNVIAIVDANNSRIDMTYDGLNRLTLEQRPQYDNYAGVAVRQQTQHIYDALGRVLQEIQLGVSPSANQVTSYVYDQAGNVILLTNAEGGKTNYYYDLMGHEVRKIEQRRTAQNETPSTVTEYRYDALGQLIETQDAINFKQTNRFNAFGEIEARGVVDSAGNALNELEYFKYDDAGRLINTNQKDGVERAYLYDAAGNMTAKIIVVVDPATSSLRLKNMDIGAISQLRDESQVSRTEYVYDLRGNRIGEYEASNTITTTGAVSYVDSWLDVRNDPFAGGSITSVAGTGSLRFQTTAFGKNGFSAQFTLNIPPVQGLGDGGLRLYHPSLGNFYAGANDTQFTGVYYSNLLGTNLSGPMTADGFRLYKSTPYGEILISDFSNVYLTGQSTSAPAWSTYNVPIAAKLRITGQPDTATTVEVKLWQGSDPEPATGIQATAFRNTAGTVVPGWFELNTSAYSGTYHYTYITRDAQGTVLSTVRGDVVLGNGAKVISKEILTQQPVFAPGDTEERYIVKQTTYDAFGQVVGEIDGRGYALAHSDTEWAIATRQALGYVVGTRGKFASELSDAERTALQAIYTTTLEYDDRGLLLSKVDPETSVMQENGVAVRARPVTTYYYDLAGRAIATQDAVSNFYGRDQYTRNVYDASNQLIQEIHADGGIKAFGYDEFGNRRWQDNELGIRTRYSYDKLNQMVRMDLPFDGTMVDGAGNVLTERYELFTYDFQGRRTGHRDARGYWEYYYYDNLGRMTSHRDTDGEVTSYTYTYDSATGGYSKTTRGADNRTLVDSTDYFGRLLKHWDLAGRLYTYTYNQAGWLLHQDSSFGVQAGQTGQNINYEYYNNGLVKRITDVTIGTQNYYEYDENGNRTLERYASTAGGVNYYQSSTAVYDELNRMVFLNDTVANYTVQHDFDANGNRIHLKAIYWQPSDINRTGGTIGLQDYWYLYDAMNRFVITQGVLDNGQIKTGNTGYGIAYNVASQRISQRRVSLAGTVLLREAYSYNAAGLLTYTYVDTNPGGTNKTVYEAYRQRYDANGNLLIYSERQGTYTTWVTSAFNWNGLNWNGATWTDTTWSNIRYEQNTYLADGQISMTIGTSYKANGTVDATIYTYYNYDAVGNLLWVRDRNPGVTDIGTHYTYVYWDTAKQSGIYKNGTVLAYTPNGAWKPGFSQFNYDANGHLISMTDAAYQNNQGRTLRYQVDYQGKILKRQEMIGAASSPAREQKYFYFNDIGIGDAGTFATSNQDYATHLAEAAAARGNSNPYTIKPVSSADFDYNFRPINDTYPATTPGSYVVQQTGQSLQSIALQVWGDGSLWYLLADANGLDPVNPNLIQGQSLVIPNVVTNIHNSSSTIKPYDANALLGNVQPTLPEAPPPKPKGGGGCGILAAIIVIIVIVVVTVLTDGALTEAGMAWLAPMAAPVAGAVAGQVAGMALGVQKGFDWGSIAATAITAGVFQYTGLASTISTATTIQNFPTLSAALNAAATNFVSQGIQLALGQQKKIDWAGVAAAGVAGAASPWIDQKLDLQKISGGFSFDAVARQSVAAMARNGLQAVTRVALTGDKVDWAMVAVDSIAQGFQAESLRNSRLNAQIQGELKDYMAREAVNFKGSNYSGGGVWSDQDSTTNSLAWLESFDKMMENAVPVGTSPSGLSDGDRLFAQNAEGLKQIARGNLQQRGEYYGASLLWDDGAGLSTDMDPAFQRRGGTLQEWRALQSSVSNTASNNIETIVVTAYVPGDEMDVMERRDIINDLGGTLKRGARGEAVKLLQRALGIEDDGKYGGATQQALRNYKAASGADYLGSMTRSSESGTKGVFTISSGQNDPGGVSYGAYQLSSDTGVMANYLSSIDGRPYADQFKGLKPGSSAFNEIYLRIADADPSGFDASQRRYLDRENYAAVETYARRLGFDTADRGIQEALYSQATQHGLAGNRTILDNAANHSQIMSMPKDVQLQAIYQERTNYFDREAARQQAEGKSGLMKLQAGIHARYARELESTIQISNYYNGYFK